jgi:hypothetical protein
LLICTYPANCRKPSISLLLACYLSTDAELLGRLRRKK